MSDQEQTQAPPQAHDEAHEEHHGASRGLYLAIGVFLTVVTVFEVFAPRLLSNGLELRPQPALISVLMAFAFVKAGLVAAFYMHLRYDSRSYTNIMIMATVVIVYFLWLLTFVGSGVNFNAGF
jgi:caa(3)-type oxidase subunit IV